MKPAVIFPDGSRLSANTWVELERELRSDSWNYWDKLKFRREMALRALNWSGTRIQTEGTSRAFFERLERAHLVLIERT